jgi:putative redox protein
VHAERAVELAITKYCSVRDSLARDIAIEYEVEVNGEPGAVRVTGDGL